MYWVSDIIIYINYKHIPTTNLNLKLIMTYRHEFKIVKCMDIYLVNIIKQDKVRYPYSFYLFKNIIGNHLNFAYCYLL